MGGKEYQRSIPTRKNANLTLNLQLEQNKESEMLDGSASKKLDDYQKKTGIPASPALVDLAKNADEIGKHESHPILKQPRSSLFLNRKGSRRH